MALLLFNSTAVAYGSVCDELVAATMGLQGVFEMDSRRSVDGYGERLRRRQRSLAGLLRLVLSVEEALGRRGVDGREWQALELVEGEWEGGML